MLKLPMAIIAASASLSLSHAEFNSNELCAAFAEKMSQDSKENSRINMGRKSHDFAGYRFIEPSIISHNQNMTMVNYNPLSKIEGDVELRPDGYNAAPTATGVDSGECSFQAMTVDNPTPGIKTMEHFTINYYKIKD
jgi:hypothetical protein